MANLTSPQTKEQVRSSVNEASEKAADLASQALDKARETASTVGQTLGSTASKVGHKAEDWTHAAGSGLKNFGETLQHQAPQEGVLGDASQAVAYGLRESGQYLEKEGIGGMLNDLTGLIRNHPIPAILVGLGVGYCLGRTLRA
jgi:hypothetical protein